MGKEFKQLEQDLFKDKPDIIDWCGVDYDGTLNFGKAINPRYTWASERWRGFEKIGEAIKNTNYMPLTSLRKK